MIEPRTPAQIRIREASTAAAQFRRARAPTRSPPAATGSARRASAIAVVDLPVHGPTTRCRSRAASPPDIPARSSAAAPALPWASCAPAVPASPVPRAACASAGPPPPAGGAPGSAGTGTPPPGARTRRRTESPLSRRRKSANMVPPCRTHCSRPPCRRCRHCTRNSMSRMPPGVSFTSSPPGGRASPPAFR